MYVLIAQEMHEPTILRFSTDLLDVRSFFLRNGNNMMVSVYKIEGRTATYEYGVELNDGYDLGL